LALTARGTPFLYYGEEIGLPDVEVPPDESIDEPARHVAPDFAWWDRSRARTPMPWSAGPGAGFTTGRPWLRLGPDHATRNVAAQAADPDSVLAAYRRIIAARHATPALQAGAMRLVHSGPDVLAYRRLATGPDDAEALIGIAFSSAGGVLPLPRLRGRRRWRPLVATGRTLPDIGPDDGEVRLAGYEGLVLVADAP
jgi:glycosidase